MTSKPFSLSFYFGGVWGSGNTGEPSSLYSESAFEQFGALTSEHGDQKQEEKWQQHGAEEREIRRSEKTTEETELVILDPEHVRSPQILSYSFAGLRFLFV